MSRIYRMIHAFSNSVDRFVGGIVTILLIILVLLVNVSVIFRYVLENPLRSTEELSLFIIVYVVFLGASMALKKHRHVGIQLLVDPMPPKVRYTINLFVSMGILYFLTILTKESYLLSLLSKTQWSPSAGISFFWLYVPVAIGSVAMIIQIIDIICLDLMHLFEKTDIRNN